MSIIDEDYSIGEPITGDIATSRLILTGWGNALLAQSDQGRVWSSTDGTTLKIYKRGPAAEAGFTSSDDSNVIASGAISAGAATLSAANSSGISGSADTSGSSGYQKVHLSYGDEPDLLGVVVSATGYLTASAWEGFARFELAFRLAKKELDRWIRERYRRDLERLSSSSRLDLTNIAEPRVLAICHARLVGWVLFDQKSARGSEMDMLQADRHMKKAREIFNTEPLTFDYDDDGDVDSEAYAGTFSVIPS